MKKQKREFTVNVRLTLAELQALEKMRENLERLRGEAVTRSDAIRQLLRVFDKGAR